MVRGVAPLMPCAAGIERSVLDEVFWGSLGFAFVFSVLATLAPVT
jgi:hypothetical protein